MKCLGFITAALALLLPRGAAADESARAAELFAQGAEAFAAERFAEAAELLEEAFELDPAPVLLYNLGRAYEAADSVEDAIEAYERYLEEEPDATNAGQVEGRLVRLRRAVQAQAEENAPALLAQTAISSEHEEHSLHSQHASPSRVGAWTLIGVGLVGAGGGFLTHHFARRHANEAQQASHRDALNLVAQEERLRRASVGLWLGGGALFLAGAIWALARRGESEDRVAVSPGSLLIRF